MRIKFDRETHSYTLNGKVLPSVTQILKGVGCIDTRWYTEEGRARGSAVDTLTELADSGKLDWGKLRTEYPTLVGYAESWVKFCKECEFQVDLSQHRVVHPDGWYAGTLDRLGLLGAAGLTRFLLDIKTGDPAFWHPLQTVAYTLCGPDMVRRGCVYLRPDSTYKLVEHTDPADAPAWQHCLGLYNYRKNKGAISE